MVVDNQGGGVGQKGGAGQKAAIIIPGQHSVQLETPNFGMVFEDRFVPTHQDSVDDPP